MPLIFFLSFSFCSAGLHLGRRQLVVAVAPVARRWQGLPEWDVAAGAPVHFAWALLLLRHVVDGLHAHVSALQRRERLRQRRWQSQRRRPSQLGAALLGQECRHRSDIPAPAASSRPPECRRCRSCCGERGLHADARTPQFPAAHPHKGLFACSRIHINPRMLGWVGV